MASDVTPSSPMLSADQLREVNNIDDALELLRETYGDAQIETAAEALGDGFALTHNKDQFCGVPLVFMGWSITPGSYPDPETGEIGNFVAARVVSKGGKFVIVDGGSGIARQLEEYTAKTGKTFLVAQKGLRVSRYKNEYTQDGATYYIDTAAVE